MTPAWCVPISDPGTPTEGSTGTNTPDTSTPYFAGVAGDTSGLVAGDVVWAGQWNGGATAPVVSSGSFTYPFACEVALSGGLPDDGTLTLTCWILGVAQAVQLYVTFSAAGTVATWGIAGTPTSLRDDFTGSGTMTDRLPDLEGWIPGGQWKKSGVNDMTVAGGVVTSAFTGAAAQYPLPDVDVDSPAMPGSDEGFVLETRFRVLASTPVTSYCSFELRDHNDLNWIHFGVYYDSGQHIFYGEAYTNTFGDDSYEEVAGVVVQDAWINLRAAVSPDGKVAVWLDDVLQFTLDIGIPFTSLRLKFVKLDVPVTAEVDYLYVSPGEAPGVDSFWTGFVNTREVV